MPAAGGLGQPGQLGPFGRGAKRLVAPEAVPVGLHRPLDLGLAAPELGDAIGPAGPLGQLGEALQRPRRRRLDPEPTLERRGLGIGLAPLLVEATPAARAARPDRAPPVRAAAPPPGPRRDGRNRAPTRARPSRPAHRRRRRRHRVNQSPASSQRPASMASRALPSQTRSSSGASWPAFSRAPFRPS